MTGERAAQRGSAASYAFETYEEHLGALRFLEVEGGRMGYLDVGQGPPLLLVHGVPTSSWLYRRMVRPLVSRGNRVIVPDLLGFGASDKPKEQALYHPRKQGERLIALMDHLGCRRWRHVCHDAGGLWTWELLLLQPERLQASILLNTIAYDEGFHPPFRRRHGSQLARLFAWLHGSRAFGRLLVSAFLANSSHGISFTREEKRGYWLALLDGGDHALEYFFSDFFYASDLMRRVHAKFPELTVPIHVIWGQRDKTLNGEEQIPLLKKDLDLPDDHIHLLPNGSHLIQEELPDNLVELMDRAIKASASVSAAQPPGRHSETAPGASAGSTVDSSSLGSS